MENTVKSLQLTSHTDLRRIAEARFGTRTPKLRLPHNSEALKRIFHELVVHQIELVMQNKELVAQNVELREARHEADAALAEHIEHENGAGQSHTEPCATEQPVAKQIELELGVCSIRDALDAALLLLAERIAGDGIAIRLALAAEVDERIVADQAMLTQIMVSLFGNAVRCSLAGGAVDITAVRDGCTMQISVTDNGAATGNAPIAFDSLATLPLEPSYSPEVDGSGFALPLLGQMVELHGGTLSAEHIDGTGNRFSFTVPLKSCSGMT
jgi:signal transduction histidine kinase